MNDTAVILAAGRGSRLAPNTDRVPKALVPVGGRPLLERSLGALHRARGIKRFVIVAGYRAEAFKALQLPAGCSTEIILNPRWAETNSMASLTLGIDRIKDGGTILEGDCCFDDRLLAAKPMRANSSVWYVRKFQAVDDGCSPREDAEGRVNGFSIEPRGSTTAQWKSCGLFELTPKLAKDYKGWLDAAVHAGRENDKLDQILTEHLNEADLTLADIGTAPWCEVDDCDDLRRAEMLFGQMGAQQQ
jgi:choline kinase